MNPCVNIKNLNEWQVKRLKEHLSKHRWYLGERGIQLNDMDLETDFINSCMDEVANDLRIEYCSRVCPNIHKCELGKLFIKNQIDR